MTISLNNITRSEELTAADVEPVVSNVKYAQRNDVDVDVEPTVANVKYAQRNDAEVEVEPIVANVKYAQRNGTEIMAVAEAV
ncbi:hypothetical protein [Burkholderia multivorans]|uniref:hypothetical protein n=1 Tax=Burkholderia multivorans TaxID=87883 RepID=UPI00027810EE|nr:hypothetical protein [Burkholderia multivorans]EJO61127.1 hypothetical protein BURMUCF2_A2310 [Burkholderia multivorans CF2]MBU9472011.1 hypothetical protein [Burkholderia multivorans]